MTPRDPTIIMNEVFALMKELNDHPHQELVDKKMGLFLDQLDEMEDERKEGRRPN